MLPQRRLETAASLAVAPIAPITDTPLRRKGFRTSPVVMRLHQMILARNSRETRWYGATASEPARPMDEFVRRI
jgi:hypothetical protein